jgi:hypothetical protein
LDRTVDENTDIVIGKITWHIGHVMKIRIQEE